MSYSSVDAISSDGMTPAKPRSGNRNSNRVVEAHNGRKVKGVPMTRRAVGTCKAFMRDESGQTMLEYIVIVVFVVIAAIVGFRVIKGIVSRGTLKASASIK
jgi:Flp pilus assembly pilin Flp